MDTVLDSFVSDLCNANLELEEHLLDNALQTKFDEIEQPIGRLQTAIFKHKE